MHTYCKLKNGKIMVVWSDNKTEETMELYKLSELDVASPRFYKNLTTVPYSEIDMTDTNLSVINYNYNYYANN